MFRCRPHILIFILLGFSPAAAEESDELANGERIYRYYCYQCHAYSGDAETLTRNFIDPPPRDFTAASILELDANKMVDAVTNGRDGTAMPSFSSVLNPSEIAAVIAYVQNAFMGAERRQAKYHSEINGWQTHGRHEDAFDFVTGAIHIETPTERLTAKQLQGRQTYLTACISCHEQNVGENDSLVWELRAVSYPRRHYSHRGKPNDIVSGASPYALHDRPAIPTRTSTHIMQGMALFQQNCAFCHAADGTGKNWIGSFLEPHPRDFTDPEFLMISRREHLKSVILDGLAGQSMPAWRDVLSDEEVEEIIDYMQATFGRGITPDPQRE
jgi:mono/diheme cytochrome c family protein